MEIIGWIIAIAIIIAVFHFLFMTPVGWCIIVLLVISTILYSKHKKKSNENYDSTVNSQNIPNGSFEKVNTEQNDCEATNTKPNNADNEYVVDSYKEKISTDLPIDVTLTGKLESSRSPYDYDEENKIYSKYTKIRESEPKFEDYLGRKFNAPSYTDKYDTGTEFKLRELLLLVWYSRVKKGRMITAPVPKYFFYQYNLNGKKVTQKFIDKGWLIAKDERYHLSEEAKQVVKFYENLWDLHKISGFPICLDDDFPNWNNGELLKDLYQREVKYLHAQIDFYNKLIWFYQNYPNFFGSEENQQSSIKYTQESIDNIQREISDFNEKIDAI